MHRPVTDARTAELASHVEAVRALARRLVRDGALAEDVAQETCAVAWQRGRFDAKWLSGVVRNVARHAFRSKARREKHEREAVVDEGEAVFDCDASHGLPLLRSRADAGTYATAVPGSTAHSGLGSTGWQPVW